MTDAVALDAKPRIPWLYAVFLIVFGAAGWFAAFQLTLDKFLVLENPDADLNCNISPIVSCGANLASAQGSAFFDVPNPLWGLAGFVAPIAVGVALLAGARFARWFWVVFNLGLAGALAFVIWLISVSILILGTLCPWCMLVWSVTIPMFFATTFRNLAEGVYGEGPRGFGRAVLPYAVPLAVVCFLAIGLLAQLRLDFIADLARTL